MKTNNAMVQAVRPTGRPAQAASKKLNVLAVPVAILRGFIYIVSAVATVVAYVRSVVHCWLVKVLLAQPDMATAGAIMHYFYGNDNVWIVHEYQTQAVEQEDDTQVEVEEVDSDEADAGDEIDDGDEFDDEPVVEHPLMVIEREPLVVPPTPEEQEKRKLAARAMDTLLDFTLSIYESLESDDPLVKPSGSFFRRTKAPWADSGKDASGEDLPKPVKRLMAELIGETEPLLYEFSSVRTIWTINLNDYPTFNAARNAIIQAGE